MSTAAAAALPGGGAASPNDTVRVACIGVRAQGQDHIRNYLRMTNVDIAAICDVDESVLDARLDMVEKAGRKRPARFTDYRKVMEDKSIDAVSIATPNHTHALITIAACQAGKDVYVEKPASHNIFEGRQMVAAAKKYDRIVQIGTNSRSGVAVREAIKSLHDGLLGEVYMARGLCFKWRDTIGHTPDQPVPPGVHYDLWLGPAPERPFSKNRFHYNWHWNWDYGNGDIGNQGIHEMDKCRWGLNVKRPTRVSAQGGHYMFQDDQQTPNTLVCTFDFEEGGKKKLLVFEVRHWISNREAGICEDRKNDPSTVGNVFYGPKGYLAIEWYESYKTFLGREQKPGPERKEGGNNWANFIQVVRSRNRAEQNAPIEEGVLSTELVHLANISYRLGRTLEMDPVTNTVKGDAEANRMFTREYRKPFVVPEKV